MTVPLLDRRSLIPRFIQFFEQSSRPRVGKILAMQARIAFRCTISSSESRKWSEWCLPGTDR